MPSLRETIRETVRSHLSGGHLAMGQCLTAVGWVGGTLPELYEEDGMIELSMADVAGAGFAVGAALAGKRPIYVIRYQGFNWYNAPIIVNYACKSKEIWRRPCPMFVRSIAMEGAIGPVAGSSHHSLYYRMPGVVIESPMTPIEYLNCYQRFMGSDDVFYVSEHRGSYNQEDPLDDSLVDNAELVIGAISITRFEALKATKILREMGRRVSFVNLVQLKPLILSEPAMTSIRESQKLIVVDDDYPEGIARSIAQALSELTKCRTLALGLENRTAGFHPKVDLKPPSAEYLVSKALSFLSE